MMLKYLLARKFVNLTQIDHGKLPLTLRTKTQSNNGQIPYLSSVGKFNKL